VAVRQHSYDPVKDFIPVTLVAQVPNILVVNPTLPVKSVGIDAYAKAAGIFASG
jgi:tripartite-type tricarboxylate transporter receptor subunit TctC